MSDLRIDVPGLGAWVARFKGADKILNEEMRKAGQRAGLSVEAKAKGYVPTWRHDLQRSITTKTTAQPLGSQTVIGTNKPYAKAIEFGRPEGAKWPPPGALLPWMASKGIAATDANVKGAKKVRNDKGEITGSIIRGGDSFIGPRRYLPNEFLIARAIAKKIKKRPYLIKAFDELKPQIRKEFGLVPSRVIARLRGGA